jgi:hypothetical protein
MLEVELIVEELKEKSTKIRLQNLEQRISSLVGEWLHGNCGSGQANRESHTNSKGHCGKAEAILQIDFIRAA